MTENATDFQKLCDLTDILFQTNVGGHKFHALDKGCLVSCSEKALNGKFQLFLYNAAYTDLVDQAAVGTTNELINQLSSWQDY